MTQRDGIKILWQHFYEWVPYPHNLNGNDPKYCMAYCKADEGELILPSKATTEQLAKRRDDLLGPDFKVTFPTPLTHPGVKYL